MNITYIILRAVELAIFAWLSYKYFSQKINMQYLDAHIKKLQQSNQEISLQNIDLIKQIEQLTYKNESLNQILEKTEVIKEEARVAAKSALFDLGNELSKQLIEIHKRENQETREITEKNINSNNEKFNGEFERIVNIVGGLEKEISQSKSAVDLIKQSLLSPSSAGRLAEITLENILKSSGLRNNLDYLIQYNLVTQDNCKLRPDVLVFLPGNSLMVIDAKASKFLMEDEQQQKDNLAKTMNLHLKSLNSKEYAEHALSYLGAKGREFDKQITLMFLPTEQAIEKIIEVDHSFMHRAWSVNIFPVGPCGLMNMLSLAKFQISDNKRLENHKIIIEEIRKLLTSVSIMTDHAQKLASNIQNLTLNYDKFAGSFNHNFLAKAKNIENLGVSLTNKNSLNSLERFQVIRTKIEEVENKKIENIRLVKEG